MFVTLRLKPAEGDRIGELISIKPAVIETILPAADAPGFSEVTLTGGRVFTVRGTVREVTEAIQAAVKAERDGG